jgi:hypothetical protein
MIEIDAETKNTEDFISEYYKLKAKYDSEIMKNKKRILNNPGLSMNEKRREFQKLVPKCINCKNPGGTIFSIKYNDEKAIRELKAICGAKVNTCNLNISIGAGKYYLFPDILKEFEEEIYTLKQKVISDKNNILFGYISTEEALERFNDLKEQINDNVSLLQSYFEEYIKIVDNKETNELINKEIEYIYNYISSIKDSIKKFNETNNTQYVNDAVDIYINSLHPSSEKLLKLKYKENMVWYESDNGVYRLIQNKYSIRDIEFNTSDDKNITFDYGITNKNRKNGKTKGKTNEKTNETKTNLISGKNKKPILIIESSSSSPSVSTNRNLYEKNSDGTIKWSDPEYQTIWNKMSFLLKEALLKDEEWLQEFMKSCVNLKRVKKPCEFKGPSNLIFPPHIQDDDQYDFGNETYNNIFNKLDKSYRKNLLSLYSNKNAVNDYSMMENTLNTIVAKELQFDKYI